MPLPAVATLLDALRAAQLLRPAQLDEIDKGDPARFAEARALGQYLLQRGWLTPFQINQVMLGRTADLILGPYVLLERLAGGERGVVYKARHQLMNRIVALKVIHQQLLNNSQAVEQFYRDVEAASKLTHDHIVHAYDAGPIGPTHFLAMEYVSGTDLEKRVKQAGPLPVALACSYVYQAALGLQHALDQRLTHGNLKPSKLIVVAPQRSLADGATADLRTTDRPDLVKIIDIGLTHLRDVSAHRSAEGNRPSAGGSVASLYLAPEQHNAGPPVDGRADVYSLGCVFAFLLTGQTPPAHTAQGRGPIESLGPDIPPEVTTTLQHMLAPHPADRISTAGEVAQALHAIVCSNHASPQVSSGTNPVGPDVAVVKPRRSMQDEMRWLIYVCVCGALLMAGAAIWQIYLNPGIGSSAKKDSAAANSTPAQVALHELKARMKNLHRDGGELWRECARFRRQFAGTPEAQEAAALQEQMPSPLDKIDLSQQPPETRGLARQFKELVGVFGEQRWHVWVGSIRDVAYRPDGKMVAAAVGNDILLWDAIKGLPQGTLKGHQGAVAALAFSPDGKRLVSGAADKLVKVWNVADKKELHNLTPGGEITAIAWAASNDLIACGAKGGSVHYWNLATEKKTPIRLAALKSPIHAVAFSPDGKTLFAVSRDAWVRSWTLEDNEEQAQLQIFSGTISHAAFAPSGGMVITAGSDKFLRLTHVALGKELKKFKQGGGVGNVAFSPNGQVVMAAGTDGVLKVWDVASGKERAVLTDPDTRLQLTCAAVGPDNETVVLGTNANVLRQWNLATEKPVIPMQPGHSSPVLTVAFAPDLSILASGGQDRAVRLWDLPAGRERIALKGHNHHITGLAFAPDGRTLASASIDKTVKLWDTTTATNLATFKEAQGPLYALDISPDGTLLAAAGDDLKLRFWDLATKAEKTFSTSPAHAKSIRGLAFAPNGQRIISVSPDQVAKSWELPAGSELTKVTGQRGDFNCVAFAPDGQTVALGGGGRFVKLWDMNLGKEMGQLDAPGNSAVSVAFAPDSQSLAAAFADNWVIIWKPVSGNRIVRQWQLPGPVLSVRFAPDGRHLATANANGSVFLFRLGPPGASWK